MLDIIFVLLFLFTIILMLYSISERNIAFCVMTAMLWYLLALFILQGIEVPYEFYDTNTATVVEGVHLIQANLIYLSYLFVGMGSLMTILFVTFALEYLTDFKNLKNKR